MHNKSTLSQISQASDDSGAVQTAQITYHEQVKDCAILLPYGYACVAPKNTLCVTLNLNGDEANQFSIPANLVGGRARLTGLKEGEVAIVNILTGSNVILKADGSAEINASPINLNWQVNLGGGGPAIARVGDSVLVGVSTGTITGGSFNHTAS